MPAISRRIGREHIAFYKAATDGVPLRLAADRYLGEGIDLRVARSALRWIGDALRVAALRHGRAGDARVIRIPQGMLERELAGAGAPKTERLKHFEAWRSRQDESFSDAELLASYESQFGPLEHASGSSSRKRAQQERLRTRQRDAFARLERMLVTAPNRRDPVEAWFEPRLAARLHRAGLTDLETLVLTLNGRGYRWFAHVPKLGVVGARRVTQWLESHREALGLELRPIAVTPRRQLAPEVLRDTRRREAAIVPFEYFVPPGHLDGSAGRNRAELARNKLRARNDYEAISTWLRAIGEGTHTYRAYRKEAERFLLWAVFEARKPLSSLDVEDCIAFRAFLADPQPAARWVSKQKFERYAIAWRPFAGPLAASSQHYAVTVLASMCEWLTRQRYLDSNPWDGVPPLRVVRGRRPNRSFTDSEWEELIEAHARAPEGAGKRRLGAILALGYGAGLRLSELCDARTGAMASVTLAGQELGWMLSVVGKGGRVREVPLPSRVLEAIRAHMLDRGLPSDVRRAPEGTPLIGALRTRGSVRAGPSVGSRVTQSLSPSALYKSLRTSFELLAMDIANSDRAAAERIVRASTHWLRHSHGSHAVARKVPLETVKENLGHASLATTTIYVTADQARRYEEMQRFANDAPMP